MKRVVVTACGVVSPIGRGRDAFFRALKRGESGVGPITLFDASTFPVRIAAEADGLDEEELRRHIPESANLHDRKVLLALAAFLDLLEDAGLPDGAFERDRALLNVGVSLEVLPMESFVRSGDSFDPTRIMAGFKASGKVLQTPLDTVNRLLVGRYRFSGPHYLNCSACAASAMAIGHSFQLIRHGLAVMACCGGCDSMINPLGIGGFALLGALSTKNDTPREASRPFDARRDGAVIGEGAGFLLLEELEHARRRRAAILAEVAGYGASLDAYKPTDPDPEGDGAVAAMAKAIAMAGIEPEQVDYINAHGTSTPKNDEVETKAIHRLFGQSARAIPVSSTKSMIGHLIAAAGVVELIASLAGFIAGFIPPTINHDQPDPYCDLDYVPNRARAWGGRHILCNSFGFGGQNAALVLRRWEDA